MAHPGTTAAGERAVEAGLEVGSGHVDLRTEAQRCCPAGFVEIELHTLALSQHAKNRTFESVFGQINVAEVGFADQDPVTSARIDILDDSLHSQSVPRRGPERPPGPKAARRAATRAGVPGARAARRAATRAGDNGEPRAGQLREVPSVVVALDSIDAASLRGIVATFRDALTDHREAINNLNVYPVPDGDTGTNMSLTLRSVVEELDGNGDDMASVCSGIAHGSLMGARGNSGVILSQILRGFSGVVAEHASIDGPLLATGLTAAAKGAYTAVGNPVEGTILTVIRESAKAATDAATEGTDLCGVLQAARDEAAASLERTPTLLGVLADAGVVDAGGAGLLLLYDAALHVVDDRPMPEPEATSKPAPHHRSAGTTRGEGGPSIADLRYEVMFLLDAPDPKIAGFKEAWAKVGDSIVVVGDGGIYNCHIHCDDIGAAIECGIAIGRPHNIRVTDLLDELAELEERDWVAAALDSDTAQRDEVPAVPTAVVAVGAGAGVVAILKSMGVHAVVAGGQSMNPSTAELVAAVESVAAPEVIILPNNKNIIAVAQQVGEQTSRTVEVVATTSVTEALASLMAYDPQATASVNAASMTEAFNGVVSGEVTKAVRDATSDAGPIATGDWLGIAKTGIQAVEESLVAAATGLLGAIVDEDHELLTVITGEGTDHYTTALIESWISRNHPDVEVEVHHGGQPLYPYFFGLE